MSQYRNIWVLCGDLTIDEERGLIRNDEGRLQFIT